MKLSTWLTKIGAIDPSTIQLGLDRVKKVAECLGIHPGCPVIIVGGTNGKGSTVATLAAIYQAAGYQTGTFTSPILFKHNEEVRVNGECASDEEFCAAFAKIDSARKEILLTPFEFHTLAAFLILQTYALDVWIIEVGLGGRLDAVNILDADVAITTSIGIDHTEWLGPTREEIGYEKSGIYRRAKPAVCGDQKPPLSLIAYADKIAAPLFVQQADFIFQETEKEWTWSYGNVSYEHLPRNTLLTQNLSTALMTVTLLQPSLPVAEEAIKNGLRGLALPGRIEVIQKNCTEIFDVSHNPAAVTVLAKYLTKTRSTGNTYAVFSMLADKDISGSLEVARDCVDGWYAATLAVKRGASREQLESAFEAANITRVNFFGTMADAYQAVCKIVRPEDRIVVFGSFHTVAEVKG